MDTGTPSSSKKRILTIQLVGLAMLCVSLYLLMFKHVPFTYLLPFWMIGLFMCTLAPAFLTGKNRKP